MRRVFESWLFWFFPGLRDRRIRRNLSDIFLASMKRLAAEHESPIKGWVHGGWRWDD